VGQYLSEFEDLANRIIGLPPLFLLSCFISELTSQIRREVQAHQPLTLVQATGLARLQEEKLIDNHQSSRACASQPVPPVPLQFVSPPPLLPSPPHPSPPALKRLSPDEIDSRHKRGLCFNCDEKYHRGHRCAS